jgi:Cupin domain
MNVRRIVTAESKSGVAVRTDTFDTAAVEFLTNIWGFDRVPTLPLRSEQVLGEYKPQSIFGPHGGIRLDLFTLVPEKPGVPSELERAANLDIGAASGMTPGKEGSGMHRTDSVDFVVVLDGEVHLGYPGEYGHVHEVALTTGDLVVQNGTSHSWRNRSSKNATLLMIVLTTERKT